MKKIKLCLAISVLQIAAFSQPKTAASSNGMDLPEIKTEIQISAATESIYYRSYVLLGQDTSKPVSSVSLGYLLPIYISSKGSTKSDFLLKKNSQAISQFLKDIEYYGEDQNAEFFHSKGQFPIKFAKNKTGGSTLFLTGLVSSKLHNTLVTTSKKRAVKVIQSQILPLLSDYINNFGKSEIQTFAVSAVYGAKDFTKEEITAILPETVTVVMPVSAIKKYANGDITDNELLKLSEIYQSDNTTSGGIRKISIELD